MTYKEQLKDQRWFDFRKKVFEHYRGCGCVGCGDYSNEGLHNIHHLLYKKGAMAWEYDLNEVVPLCNSCHEQFHETQQRLNKLIQHRLLLNPMDFMRIVDLFEKQLNDFKKLIGYY